jgi:hypothetical protein
VIRILYECLDWEPPAGGIRRLYRHVEILSRNFYDARILHHSPGFKVKWFESDAPISYLDSGFSFSPTDVLVIPEGHTDYMRSTAHLACKRLVIALSWARIFQYLRVGENWTNFGITEAIAGSRFEQEFIKRSMNLESTVLQSGIDSALFKPAFRKREAIASMPRKNPDVLHLIQACFRSRFPQYSDIPFESIDGVSHRESARILSECAFFLAHTYPEGLSRKALEAMGCGCIVVGFDGRGSREFMINGKNCLRVEDGDILGAAEQLAFAIESFRCGDSKLLQFNAVECAKTYSLEAEEAAVLSFWRHFIAQSTSGL